MRLVIVDYGSGNLRSVAQGLARVGVSSEISRDPGEVAEATHLIVPGVGAFSDCMKQLDARGLIAPIRTAIDRGRPYLGICLGYQILFSEGTESGFCRGLDILPGQVVRFPDSIRKVPHIGWNTIKKKSDLEAPLFSGIPDGAYFYFVHSYYPVPTHFEDVATTTAYGVSFASSIARGRLFGCQFHPEKSQAVGLRLLRNFAELPSVD